MDNPKISEIRSKLLEACAAVRAAGGRVINKVSWSEDEKCFCPLAAVGRDDGAGGKSRFQVGFERLGLTEEQALSFAAGFDGYRPSHYLPYVEEHADAELHALGVALREELQPDDGLKS